MRLAVAPRAHSHARGGLNAAGRGANYNVLATPILCDAKCPSEEWFGLDLDECFVDGSVQELAADHVLSPCLGKFGIIRIWGIYVISCGR